MQYFIYFFVSTNFYGFMTLHFFYCNNLFQTLAMKTAKIGNAKIYKFSVNFRFYLTNDLRLKS